PDAPAEGHPEDPMAAAAAVQEVRRFAAHFARTGDGERPITRARAADVWRTLREDLRLAEPDQPRLLAGLFGRDVPEELTLAQARAFAAWAADLRRARSEAAAIVAIEQPHGDLDDVPF